PFNLLETYGFIFLLVPGSSGCGGKSLPSGFLVWGRPVTCFEAWKEIRLHSAKVFQTLGTRVDWGFVKASISDILEAVSDIPNNNNGWIKEDPEMEEEEEEEMKIKDEMNDPKIINPYKIEEGELLPPPAESNTSFDFEPEVEAEDGDENKAATVGTITRAPYHVQPFLGTTYVGSRSSRKVFAPGPMGKDVDILHRKRRSENREHYELKQSMSALEDQMRGLMLEDKEEKERILSPKRMSHAAIEKLVADKVAKAIAGDRAQRNATDRQGNNANGAGGQDRAPPVCECTFSSFMKCNRTPFHGKVGAIELCQWFKKSEMVFSIMATLGLKVANKKYWGDMKKIMMEEFFVGNKMHKAFPLPGESSHWQYKFPLPVEGVPTARRKEIQLPVVCTTMMKKLPFSSSGIRAWRETLILGDIPTISSNSYCPISQKKMDHQYPTLAKIPVLDTGKFEQWQFRIQQYLQLEHYAQCEVIEFGDSYKAPTNTDLAESRTGRTITPTTEDMQKKKNDVKARTTLLLSLPDEHQLRFSKYKTARELWAAILKTFGGNEATKKRKTNLLKQQYGNFKAE
nr:hypothetical protein [Tanacetum cinerariifolium]